LTSSLFVGQVEPELLS